MSKSSSAKSLNLPARTKKSARPFDDESTLSAISQIVARSQSIENATLDSLHFLFSHLKVSSTHLLRIDTITKCTFVTKSSQSFKSEDVELIEADLQRELLAIYPVLPEWPLQIQLRPNRTKNTELYLWLKTLDPIDSSNQFALALTFSSPIALNSIDLHSLEVAASVLRHKISLDPSAPRANKDPLEHPSRFRLSERQVTISKMILAGLTNKEIAQNLNLSAATIRYECVRLYERLGAKNRASAAAILQNLFSGNHSAVAQDF